MSGFWFLQRCQTFSEEIFKRLRYVYNAAGERVLKSNGGGQTVAISGSKKAGKGSIGNFTIYVNPYVVLRNSMVTKYFYIESQRVATKLTESNEGLLQNKAGGNKVDYTNKQAQLQGYFSKQYADLDIELEKVDGTVLSTIMIE